MEESVEDMVKRAVASGDVATAQRLVLQNMGEIGFTNAIKILDALQRMEETMYDIEASIRDPNNPAAAELRLLLSKL